MHSFLDQQIVITKTLELIALNGFDNLDIPQIAHHINCTVGDIYFYFPSKIRMLKSISIFLIDNQLKILDPAVSKFSIHDRLFEILFSFCEVNDHYKLAIGQIIHDIFKSPQLILSLSIFWSNKFRDIFHNFDICFSKNIKGHIRFNGLMLMTFKFYYIWLMNHDCTNNELMYQLDKSLRLWEKFTNNLH